MPQAPRTAEQVQGLQPSLEEQYLANGAQTPSDIYFELGSIVASRVGITINPELISAFVTEEDLANATLEAKRALAYRIGSRAAYADFGSGKQDELERLSKAI